MRQIVLITKDGQIKMKKAKREKDLALKKEVQV
jgi:hypothetical protein